MQNLFTYSTQIIINYEQMQQIIDSPPSIDTRPLSSMYKQLFTY